jgi:signal peptidase I
MKTVIILSLLLLTACAPKQPPSRAGLTPEQADVVAFMATKPLNHAGAAAVKGTSMEPELRQGDIALYLVRPYAAIREGQIILFRQGDQTIAHRAMHMTNDGWITKGDNQRYYDPNPVTKDNYVGTVFGIIWQ